MTIVRRGRPGRFRPETDGPLPGVPADWIFLDSVLGIQPWTVVGAVSDVRAAAFVRCRPARHAVHRRNLVHDRTPLDAVAGRCACREPKPVVPPLSHAWSNRTRVCRRGFASPPLRRANRGPWKSEGGAFCSQSFRGGSRLAPVDLFFACLNKMAHEERACVRMGARATPRDAMPDAVTGQGAPADTASCDRDVVSRTAREAALARASVAVSGFPAVIVVSHPPSPPGGTIHALTPLLAKRSRDNSSTEGMQITGDELKRVLEFFSAPPGEHGSR
jgi:hypothetical protein